MNKKKWQSSFYIRSAYTQNIIARADKMNHLRKVIQCQRSNSQNTFFIKYKWRNFNIQIGTMFSCSCCSLASVNGKTCFHIAWVLHYNFQWRSSIEKYLMKWGNHCHINFQNQFENGRIFSLKPKNYPRSENEQIWYFSTKKSGVPSRYSGCICMWGNCYIWRKTIVL